MENLIISVNKDPNKKNILFGLISNEKADLPKSNDTRIAFVKLPLSNIINVNDEIYSGITIGEFIKNHNEALKILPAFKFSSLTKQWYFELSVKEFTKIRSWEIKQFYLQKMLNRYPIWKQINLTNDKDYALLQLSNLTQLNTEEVMKNIQQIISINNSTCLNDIKKFQKNIGSMDFKKFSCLQPITFKVSDIEKWVIPVLNYLIYYYTACRLRYIITNEEKRLNLCTTYEAINFFNPIDPTL
ncbi:hypothetical protein Ga0466249_001523 [Sporomusaceae bacterium BoRhaA]|uniref:hypothetical protein n=1 Tax=Pelorhabdus rhamnosifermentans TaxID=2772457 RepID=UPI001C06166C|nr:hypothetical protein [Pelorhabdus rhamnosifermentans]MBU2700431.1 hypothetical protein [Pelorhabdus rhamnosifermentans]